MAWSVVVLVASAPVGCEVISGLDGLSTVDASVEDVSTATDALVDVVDVVDAVAPEGGDGGQMSVSWCSAHGMTALLCEDFDQPGEKAGDNWTGGADAGVGAMLGIVTNVASSQPASLFAAVPGSGVVQATVTEGLASLSTHPVVLSFDLLVALMPNNCSTPNLVTLGAVARVGSNGIFALVGYAMSPVLYLQSASGYVALPILGIMPGVWTRVALAVEFVAVDGGSAIQGAVYLGDAGTQIAIDAQAPVAAGSQVFVTNGVVPTSASVGAMDIANSIACTVHIDNVLIFQ